MKFSEMPYRRVEVEEAAQRSEEIRKALAEASSYEEARAAFMEQQKLDTEIETQYALVYVRHSIDTTDTFYDKENEYWDSANPMLQEFSQKFTKELLKTPFRKEFEREFGSLLFQNAEISLKAFSPEIIPEIQEENSLTSAYAKLIASAQIDFQGEKRTLPQMTPFKQSPDDKVREAAWKAEGAFYMEHGEELDTIYDKLVKVRDKMAKKMGYKNYVELGYYRMMRNCYTAEDVKDFRDAVRKYLVPVADSLEKEQARRNHTPYPLSFWDEALKYRSGNAKPFGTPEEILANGRKMYREMSSETAEFIDFLYENELLDVLSRKGKAGGGYCISLPKYKAPFIFANFNGTSGDVEVITHEAGHAFAAYMAKDIVPLENQSPTLEACEIHSMSMEFFAWDWAEGFFGKDTEKFHYGHLADAITFIPYGSMVDHFQHIMYEHPEMKPEERQEAWRKLEEEYRPWLKLEGLPFYGDGRGWQRQHHIYEDPFYYIDYCLAQSVALQFWALIQKDRKDAWERYMRLVKKAGTQTYRELVQTAGLSSPFGEKALSEISAAAREYLDAFDRSALQ